MAKMIDVKCQANQCGKMFAVRVADRARGWGRFCSKRCKAIEQEARTGQYRALLANAVRVKQQDDSDLVTDDMLDHFSGDDPY